MQVLVQGTNRTQQKRAVTSRLEAV